MGLQFQKRVEDFVCEHCAARIKGDGYTNHCSRCLWSKHVDKYPGDRLEACGGMMEPVLLEGSSPNYRILHRCTACGLDRVNKVQVDDIDDAIIHLAQHPHPPLGIDINVETGEEHDPLWREKKAAAYLDHNKYAG